MFTTTAIVAYGNNVVAPCANCGTPVIIRIENQNAGLCNDTVASVPLSGGTAKCKGCDLTLSAHNIRIPRNCWQPSVYPEQYAKYRTKRRDLISAAHNSNGVN